MARDFSKNLSNYMQVGTDVINQLLSGAGAISAHVHVYYDTLSSVLAGSDDLLYVPINGTSSGLHLLLTGTAGAEKLRVQGRSQTADAVQLRTATTTITTGSWWRLGGVLNIASDVITPYVNGSAESSGAVTFGAATYTPGTPTAAEGIGNAISAVSSTQRQVDGRMGEVAIWLSDIGAAGFAMLAAGVSALMISPSTLIFYMPMLGYASPEIDVISAKSGTITGTVAKAEHPRIINPTRHFWFPPIAAAGGTIPRVMYSYRARRV